MLELGSTLQRRVMILTWSAPETLRASKPTDIGLQERWRGGSVRHSYLHIRLIFAVAGLTLFSPSPAWALLSSSVIVTTSSTAILYLGVSVNVNKLIRATVL